MKTNSINQSTPTQIQGLFTELNAVHNKKRSAMEDIFVVFDFSVTYYNLKK